MAYAAKLIDPTYRVEMGLYPLPENEDQLATVLNHLSAMPHSAEERASLLKVIAAHVDGTFPKKASEAAFAGGLAEMKGEDFSESAPVEITLDEKNYALLYSAVQYANESRGPITQFDVRESADETGDTETEESAEDQGTEVTESVEETPAETETSEDAATDEDASQTEATEDSNPLLSQIEALAGQLEALRAEATKPKEPTPTPTSELSESERKLQEAEDTAKKAVAASVALYMKTLHKPQARDKSQEALVSELMEKSLDVLQDRLEVLTAEAAAGPLPNAGSLPVVEDPTKSAQSKGEGQQEGQAPNPEELKNTIEESDDEDTYLVSEDSDALNLLFRELRGDDNDER